MSQPTFRWNENDRALLVPGCTVVVYRWYQHDNSVRPSLIKIVKVHRDHVFHEVTCESFSFTGGTTKHFVTEELAHCDPSSLPGYVAPEPEPQPQPEPVDIAAPPDEEAPVH